MKILLLIYLIGAIGAFLYNSYKSRKSKGVTEWVPKEYRNEFLGCSPSPYPLFDKGEEIPGELPVLLILGHILTSNKGVLFLDRLANFLTFGWLRFNEIIPVSDSLSLKLYFRNISKGNFSIQGRKTRFRIIYPGTATPSRTWSINIPSLHNPGDCCFDNSELFFRPEVPGTHELQINGYNDLVYAGPYGVSGRRYRIPMHGGPWLFRFHVSSGYEYRVFIVAFFALAVAIITLILTLIGKI
jgi:hypothetical protein